MCIIICARKNERKYERNMKENKKIDNKMRAKKLAAYTLATCMTVTVAPIGATNVFAETSIEMFAAGELTVDSGKGIEFSINNSIKAGDKYSDAASKLALNYKIGDWSSGVTSSDSTGKWSNADAATIVIKDENGTALWKGDGSMDTPDDTKFESGKSYLIEAKFTGPGITGEGASNIDGTVVALSGSSNEVATPNSDISLTVNGVNGLDDNQTGGAYVYRDADGNRVHITTVAQNKNGWFYVEDGLAKEDKTVVASNQYGTWACIYGKVDFTYTGFVTDANTNVTYYAEKGQVTGKATGFFENVSDSNKLYNVVNSKVVKCDPTVAFDGKKWRYIGSDGIEDTSKVGFASNKYGTWYVNSGIVDFTTTDASITDTNNDLKNGAAKDYYVVKGQVMLDKTGVVFLNDNSSVYVKNGIIQPTSAIDKYIDKEQLAYNPTDKKWYLIGTDGRIKTDSAALGLYSNEYGTWFVQKDGTVNFAVTGFYTDDNGDTWYVEKGQAMKKTTKVVDAKNIDPTGTAVTGDSTKKYVKAGKVTGLDINQSVVLSDGKWYLIKSDGDVSTAAKQLGANSNGIWVATNGIVDFTETQSYPATVDDADIKGIDAGDVLYIKDSKVQTNFTGVTDINTSGSTTIKYVENGKVNQSTSVVGGKLVQGSDKKWYYVDSDGIGGKSGIVSNQYGTWLVASGTVDFTKTGFVKDTDGLSGKNTDIYYVEDGKVITTKNGIVEAADKTTSLAGGTLVKYNLANGKAAGKTLADSVVQAADKNWYYVNKDGKVDTTYNGIAGNKYGVWKIDGTNGKVNFTDKSVATLTASGTITVADQAALIKGVKTTDSIFISKSQVMTGFTGYAVANGGDDHYVKNGVSTTNGKTSIVVPGSDGKYYAVKNGSKETYTGLIKDAQGTTWYVNAGVVDSKKTGIVTDTDTSTDYYVENGKMAGNKNGLVTVGKNQYLVKDNKVVKTKADKSDAIKLVDGKWYYIDATGKWNKSYSGLAGNENGIFMIKDGVVDFNHNSVYTVIAAEDGLTGVSQGDKVYIAKGYFKDDYTGVAVTIVSNNYVKTYVEDGKVPAATADNKLYAVYGTDNKWYVVKNKAVDSTSEGLAENDYGTWYVKDGAVQFTKTGIITDATLGKCYVEKGKFIDNKTGIVSDGTDKWYVEDGKVATPSSNLVQGSDKAWYYVLTTGTPGKVDTTFTGIAKNAYGIFYVKKGVVDFNYTGFATITEANYDDVVTDVSGAQTIYVEKGEFDTEATKIVDYNGQKWYVKNGLLSRGTGIVESLSKTEKYVIDSQGRVVQSANGIYSDSATKQWYVKNGKVDTTFTGTYDGHEITNGLVTK